MDEHGPEAGAGDELAEALVDGTVEDRQPPGPTTAVWYSAESEHRRRSAATL